LIHKTPPSHISIVSCYFIKHTYYSQYYYITFSIIFDELRRALVCLFLGNSIFSRYNTLTRELHTLPGGREGEGREELSEKIVYWDVCGEGLGSIRWERDGGPYFYLKIHLLLAGDRLSFKLINDDLAKQKLDISLVLKSVIYM
jgi:hypothetical protein